MIILLVYIKYSIVKSHFIYLQWMLQANNWLFSRVIWQSFISSYWWTWVYQYFKNRDWTKTIWNLTSDFLTEDLKELRLEEETCFYSRVVHVFAALCCWRLTLAPAWLMCILYGWLQHSSLVLVLLLLTVNHLI